MPVDPYTASSFGSVYASRPGSLKESACLGTLCVNTSGAAGELMPLWSGTAGDNTGYDGHMGSIPLGKQLLIFNQSCVNGNTGESTNYCQCAALVVSGNSGADTTAYQFSATAWSAKALGPFMISWELPLQFVGPCNVWAAQLLNSGGGSSARENNYSTFGYVITDATNLRNT